MRKIRSISAVLGLTAAALMLAFNCWLAHHHGHDPADGLFPGDRGQSRAVFVDGECTHRGGDDGPIVDHHELELHLAENCLVCALFHGQGLTLDGPVLHTIPRTNTGAVTVSSTVYLSPRPAAYHLRAPPAVS